MRYLEEYRNQQSVSELLSAIRNTVTRSWTLMEVCGGQTHAIIKYGIDTLLPKEVELIHGPGCPVCVTPVALIDQAVVLACRPDVIFCSFGDMLRVPGNNTDLLSVKAQGADVRMVYSPTDAVKVARQNPNKQVVFFAVGFETTAPGNALAVMQADQEKLTNFSMLVSHMLVPPAMERLLQNSNSRIQGFLAAGHVCTVMGYREYEPLAKKYQVPIVVTGFEPLDILQGIYLCVKQLESGRSEVKNQYLRSVQREGNPVAQKVLHDVFKVVPRHWRGLGEIPASGLGLTEQYGRFDAKKRFGFEEVLSASLCPCISGEVLQGKKKPFECPAFGRLCRPERPLGATMVSSEGACAAYFHYRGQEVHPGREALEER